jgi:hypothetical protein
MFAPRSEAHAAATVACHILLQLLTTCDSRREVHLERGSVSNHFPVSGLSFSHFLAQIKP